MPENTPKDIEVVFSRDELSNRKRKEILSKLCNRIGEQNVSNKEIDRISYSRDCWPMSMRWMLEGKIVARPDYIVWPVTTQQVSDVLTLANEMEIPVINTPGYDYLYIRIAPCEVILSHCFDYSIL